MIARLALASVLVVASACARTARTGAIAVEITRSRFDPGALEVPTGSEVTFTVRNTDPIAHEFIIGSHTEQLAHEQGTDASHDGTPGAASLDPDETATLTHRFTRAGTYEYACHLPGHYRYGMVGTITVT